MKPQSKHNEGKDYSNRFGGFGNEVNTHQVRCSNKTCGHRVVDHDYLLGCIKCRCAGLRLEQ